MIDRKMYMCAKAYDIDTKGSLGMWEAFCLAYEIPKPIDWLLNFKIWSSCADSTIFLEY